MGSRFWTKDRRASATGAAELEKIMNSALKTCTSETGKHKWAWEKDITHTAMGKRPGYVNLSRKGVYRCACGETKYGMARSGL